MSGTRRRAWQTDGLEWAGSYVGQVQHVETSARRDARMGVTVGAIFEIKMSFKYQMQSSVHLHVVFCAIHSYMHSISIQFYWPEF